MENYKELAETMLLDEYTKLYDRTAFMVEELAMNHPDDRAAKAALNALYILKPQTQPAVIDHKHFTMKYTDSVGYYAVCSGCGTWVYIGRILFSLKRSSKLRKKCIAHIEEMSNV